MRTKLLFFFFLLMLLQVNMSTSAMVLKDAHRIMLKDIKASGSHRSMPVLPTAFIDGSLLSVDFLSAVTSAAVTVRNSATGEIVYSSVEMNVTTLRIDLTGKSAGEYSLEIGIGDTILSGDFLLEYDKYKDQVKFGFVSFGDFPTLPALACEAAARQDKFWDFHDDIFAHKGLADSTFIFNLAKTKNLDITQFRKDLHSSENYKKLDKTINDLVNRGVFATPTIIVNDRLVYMTNSYEELSRLLEYELR